MRTVPCGVYTPAEYKGIAIVKAIFFFTKKRLQMCKCFEKMTDGPLTFEGFIMWSDALYLLLAILAILVVLVDATTLTKKRKNIVTN